MKFKFEAFNTIIVREPKYSLNDFTKVPLETEKIDDFIINLFKDEVFKEGIYIATPELFNEWKKSCLDKNYPTDKRKRVNNSILKYFIRATTNPVPFGLFSSYSIIDKNHVKSKKTNNFELFTSIDMLFLSTIIRQLNNNNNIKKCIVYYTNNTLYEIGNKYRYISSKDDDLGNKNYFLSSADIDEVLTLVITTCQNGKTVSECVKIIIDNVEDVSNEDATSYINDLIDSKILVSSLDICLNGDTPVKQVLNFLNDNFNESWAEDEFINRIYNLLCQIDLLIENIESKDEIGGNIHKYEELINIIESSKIDYKNKYVLNLNLKKNINNEDEIIDFDKDENILLEAIYILNLFSDKNPENKFTSFKNLKKFKTTFYERYENREVPLLHALDNVTGIGYIQELNDYNSFSELIDNLDFNHKTTSQEIIYSNLKLDTFWSRTIINAISKNLNVIDLKTEDLSQIEILDYKLIGTFPIMYNKINDKIAIVSAGGSTALHYIGRFTCSDVELTKFGNEIVKTEELLFPDNILAEILHLPHERAANVSIRKVNRKNQITILTNPAKASEIIDLKDILISVKNDKIILRSKKNDKEIIPFLSSAQNFHSDTLPIYHLLCDIQAQYRPNLLSLDLSSFITNYFNYIPRIEYGPNLILSPATWRFSITDFKSILDVNQNIIYEKFQDFRIKFNIPRFINLIDSNGDSMVIDIENKNMVDLINSTIKKSKSLTFTECLYNIESLQNKNYANEYIMSFKAKEYISSLKKEHLIINNTKRTFIPGDEWLYYKIYTGVNIADNLLITVFKEIINVLKRQKLIDSWFFIRYNDPNFHLRIRFHMLKSSSKEEIINVFNTIIKDYVENGTIWKIELSNYERELERYAFSNIKKSEMIFSHDSDMIITLIESTKQNNELNIIWLYSLKAIDDLLNAFEIELFDRFMLLKTLYKDFSIEFNANKKLKKQIDAKFRISEKIIEQTMNEINLYSEILYERYLKIKPLAISIKLKIEKKVLLDLIASHIHMHINRVIKSNARMHELVIYGILEKFYRKKIGLSKYSKPINN